MSDNKFDNYFRDRLQEQASPVPADMWQRIHPEQRPRKGIFSRIWWLIVPVLVLTGLFIGHRSSTSVVTRSGKITQSTAAPSSGMITPPAPATPSGPTTSSVSPNTPTQPLYPAPPSAPQNSSVRKTHRTSKPTFSHETSLFHDASLPASTTLTKSPITLRVQHQQESFKHRPPLPADSSKTSTKKQAAHTSKWHLDAYASPDLPLNHQGRLSYTAGFRLGRTFGQHFSATAGLQYSRIRENLYLDSGEAIKVYLKTLDIPLLAGYTMRLGNTKTTITGGIIVNIRSRNKLGPNFIGTDYYKTNTGLSLYLGLNYTQPLSKKLSLFAEPYLRYRLTEMTERGPFFPEKIHVAGLSLGLRYGF